MYRNRGYTGGYRSNYKKRLTPSRWRAYNRAVKTRYATRNGGMVKKFVPRNLGNPLALAERKYYDSGFGGPMPFTITDWAGCEADPAVSGTLFSPAQGTNFNQRIGRKVQLLSLRIDIVVEVPTHFAATAPPSYNNRVILYQDKQSNGVQAQAEAVINQENPAALLPFNMAQNVLNFGRYKVIRDKRIIIGAIPTTFDGTDVLHSGNARHFRFTYKPKKPLYVNFSNPTGTIADIVDNSFHIIACTDVAGVVVQLQYRCRGCYIDI